VSSSQSSDSHLARSATLKLSHEADMPVLTAKMPAGASREEFAKVAGSAFDLISKLTGHPCFSGRIKFVVDDPIMNEVTRVDLRTS
jgi:hypothetical protein